MAIVLVCASAPSDEVSMRSRATASAPEVGDEHAASPVVELVAPARAEVAGSGDAVEAGGDADAADVGELTRGSSRPEPKATLVVRFLDPEGRPIADINPLGAVVGLRGVPYGGIPCCFPRETPPPSSESRFRGVTPGEQVAEVRVPGFLPSEFPFTAVDGSDTVVVVRLDRGMTFAGTVVDEDGRPVAGAQVELQSERARLPWGGPTASSGADGQFEFTGLVAGRWNAQASREATAEWAYSETKEPIAFDSTQTDARLVLTRWSSIVVRPIGPDGAPVTPVGECCLGRMPFGIRAFQSIVADERGRRGFGPLGAGPTRVVLTFADFAPLRLDVQLDWAQIVELGDVRLDPGVTWTGRVVDGAGRAVAGAAIRLDVEGSFEHFADADGRFAISHLPRTGIHASFASVDYVDTEFKIDRVREDASSTVVLSRGGVLRGRLAMEHAPDDGSLAAHRVAPAAGESEHPMQADGDVRDDGTFRVRLSAGRWRLAWAVDLEHETPLGEWTVVEGQTKDVGTLARPK